MHEDVHVGAAVQISGLLSEVDPHHSPVRLGHTIALLASADLLRILMKLSTHSHGPHSVGTGLSCIPSVSNPLTPNTQASFFFGTAPSLGRGWNCTTISSRWM